MKKTSLLLTLPLATLMAIDFTMTPEGLFTEDLTETTTDIVPSADNPYLATMTLPACDGSNPEVQFIKSSSDWGTINSSSKSIFCVAPGDYRSLGNIELTRSGTADKRRYILLDNGNDTHPGKLNESQLANFGLEFSAASYWVIDRAAAVNYTSGTAYIIGHKSTNNLFNRMLTQNVYHTMRIRNNAHYNTIQNSRFNGITDAGAAADLATINLAEWPETIPEFFTFGTKVINNEFINVKPIRLNHFPDMHLPEGVSQHSNFAGSIFDSNTIEYNKAIRTDCNGNYDPNGDCMAGEANGGGAKAGSDDPNKPVIFSNNHVWGYRPSDPTYEKLSSVGTGISVYMGAKNVHVKNNVMYDGTRGLKISSSFGAPHGTENALVTGNLIVECGDRPGSKDASSIELAQANEAIMKNNTVINPIGYTAKIYYNHYDNYFGESVVINPDRGILYEENWEKVSGMDTIQTFNSATEAGYTKDYTFVTDKFTNNPRTITIPNAVKAE